MRLITIVAAGGTAALLLGETAFAQGLRIECSGDLDVACRAQIKLEDATQRSEIRLRVTRGGAVAPGAIVRLRTTSGTILPDSATADNAGMVTAIWFRNKSADVVGIAVAAHDVNHNSATQYLRLTVDALNPPPPKKLGLVRESGFLQSWFEKGQLPKPVSVEVVIPNVNPQQSPLSISESSECSLNRVIFVRKGAPATVSPDTATASIVDGKCYASTFWSLGEGIGERTLEISALPGKGFERDGSASLEAYAWARATPKFVAGFARSKLKAYRGITPAVKRTVRIESANPDGSKRAYDAEEIVTPATLNDFDEKIVVSAVAAISVPVPLAFLREWDGLSLTAGVDLSAPSDRLLAGISLLRLAGRLNPVIEQLPVDVHMLGFWARQPVLVDPSCSPELCKSRDRMRYQGLSFMLTGDATSLLSELVKKITGG